MCIICVDYLKGLLTPAEARRNASEAVDDLKHLYEIEKMLQEDAEDADGVGLTD